MSSCARKVVVPSTEVASPSLLGPWKVPEMGGASEKLNQLCDPAWALGSRDIQRGGAGSDCLPPQVVSVSQEGMV
jgi:hypothetical protein